MRAPLTHRWIQLSTSIFLAMTMAGGAPSRRLTILTENFAKSLASTSDPTRGPANINRLNPSHFARPAKVLPTNIVELQPVATCDESTLQTVGVCHAYAGRSAAGDTAPVTLQLWCTRLQV